MNSRLSICLTLYRRLANAYPHEFRMLYGEDLDRMGEDAVPEVSRRYGLPGLLRLLADIAVQLPATYLLEIRKDVIYALRVLAKSPGFTSVAVLSLALGIGMCCAILSQTQAIVGPPPGVRDPAALVTFHWSLTSYPYFERYREERQVVSAATAFLGPLPFAVAFTADKSAKAERFYGHLVSPDYFSTLGVTPASGRLFSPKTEKPGMPPVVVVSDRFWRSHLDADPHAVGRRLRLNGLMATIVGIAPKDFLGIWPGRPADLFVPATCNASVAPELRGNPLNRPDREIFRVVLRLAPGTTMQAAEAALNTITRNLDRENGVEIERARKGKIVRLMPAGTILYITPEQHAFVNTLNVVLWALVLALVCANLANLLLARGGQRRREIAVRLSVGASRPRLIRQFLTESVLLALAGGLAGVVLAYGITHVMSSLPVPSPTPQEFNCQPDFRVLALTLAIALAAGVGFGLAPALSSTRVDIGGALKEGAQAPLRGYRRFGSRNLFMVCQMAASLMLLLVTWFVATGFLNTSRLNVGFETGNLILISLDPVRDGYSAEEASALFASLPDELSRTNGVRGVSLTGSVPFASLAADQANTRVTSPAADGSGGQVLRAVFRERIGANYFATLGVPLLDGREFDGRDQRQTELGPQGAALPAILNQTAARELFGSEAPIGRRIRERERNYTVVGLTRDVPSGFLTTKPVATLFLPLTAEWFRKNPSESITILLRAETARNTLTSARSQLQSLHPDLTVFNVRTMREDLGRLNSFVEWQATIYMTLGLFALLLACIGLGGVTAYAVARRRKEIGIRMALGARGSQVQALVLKEGMALLVLGSVLGLSGAFLIARVFAAYSDTLARSFGQRHDNPALIFGAPLVLAGLAMLACYLPARRATEIDPMAALREE
jgi:macrolide transport system ATP-binding/permease protein